MKNNMKYLLSFPIVLSNLDLNVSDSDPMITQLAYGTFLLSLVALFCFVNISGYVIVHYILLKGNYEDKYPRLKRLIKYFKTVGLVYLTVEVLLCLTCLILLNVFSLLFILR
jgi:hypothetical protein